jgi:hypothetical protein
LAVPFVLIGGLAGYCLFRPGVRPRAMLLGAAMLTGYGMLQDQVSARLCPEYFTVLHNPIPGVADPTVLGLLWGFLGAAPGGLILGYAAGLAATLGPHPSWGLRRLVAPMLGLVGFVATVTAVTGVSVARHLELFDVRFADSTLMPAERQRWAFVVACYHWAAYVSAMAGSIGLCVWVGRGRSLDAARPPL